MADISKITLPSGTTYNIKDAVARSSIGGAIIIRGTTTTTLSDGSTTNPITINAQSYTAVANDAVFYNKKELVFDGTEWHEFGDMTGLGSLATKNSASGSYTPAGTCSGGDVELNTTSVNSITDVGTLPELSTTVVNETLVITFSQGTLPTKGSNTSVATGVKTVTQPTFTGTQDTITVS